MNKDEDNQKALDELDQQILEYTKEVDPEAELGPLTTLFGYSSEDLVDITLSKTITVQRARLKELAAGLGIDLPSQDYEERCKLDSAIEAVRDMKPTNELERNLAYNFVAINSMSRDAALQAHEKRTTDPTGSDKAAQLFLKGNGAALKNAEAIDRLRNRGRQQITVKRLNVNSGVQAIMNDVDARTLIQSGDEEPMAPVLDEPMPVVSERKTPKSRSAKSKHDERS